MSEHPKRRGYADVIRQRMERANQPDIAIRTFQFYYQQAAEGRTGLVPERDIQPADGLVSLDQLGALEAAGRAQLDRVAVVKLNGGLGTSMGLKKAKSLLLLKQGLSFLDIIARQVLHVRETLGAPLPLLFMNSFATQADSLEALAPYALETRGLPLDFVQHRVPKLSTDTLAPVDFPAQPALEWCPPGHGDLYTALLSSGALQRLLDAGVRWAFVSNADNLGATLSLPLLGYIAQEQLPFVMEVADRTVNDRKGGHLARTLNGQLVLRESAMCPKADVGSFQDIERHRYFNTNNLWVDLEMLAVELTARNGVLGLPMIRNRKTVDPSDASSQAVFQLETAMGSAIGVFAGAAAVRVSRQRFAPVKTCEDLLRVWSDAFVLQPDYHVVQSPQRAVAALRISLDPRYYKHVDDLLSRFPAGPPSLIQCESLTVRGDVRFAAGLTLNGKVTIENTREEQIVYP